MTNKTNGDAKPAPNRPSPAHLALQQEETEALTMDWIEVTAAAWTTPKELALDRLGVVEDELEYEILDEPKGGLFGLGRADARIRARVKPLSRDKPTDRRRRGKGRSDRPSRSGSGSGSGAAGPSGRRKPPARRRRAPENAAGRRPRQRGGVDGGRGGSGGGGSQPTARGARSSRPSGP